MSSEWPSNIPPVPQSVYKRTDAKEVKEFHTKDDVDSGRTAHHHTLGKGVNQAAPGNHDHDEDYSDIGHDHDSDYSPVGHTHSYVPTGSLKSGKVNTGAYAAANTDKTTAVAFTTPFSSIPNVKLTTEAASSQNVRYEPVATNITVNGFDIVSSRAVGTGAVDIHWIATNVGNS